MDDYDKAIDYYHAALEVFMENSEEFIPHAAKTM